VAEPAQAYDVIKIEGDPYVQREYLGNLADFPDMYEITSAAAFTLTAQIRQRATKEPIPFALILVKQNEDDGGVTEIVRFNQESVSWQPVKRSPLGFGLMQSEVLQQAVEPGTYRIEISTPDNQGDYMLVIGDEETSSGYFESLADINLTQKHFGYSPFRLFLSSYVYYPLGIIVILFGMFKTWQWRKKAIHVS
jgi:hypothetical protein